MRVVGPPPLQDVQRYRACRTIMRRRCPADLELSSRQSAGCKDVMPRAAYWSKSGDALRGCAGTSVTALTAALMEADVLGESATPTLCPCGRAGADDHISSTGIRALARVRHCVQAAATADKLFVQHTRIADHYASVTHGERTLLSRAPVARRCCPLIGAAHWRLSLRYCEQRRQLAHARRTCASRRLRRASRPESGRRSRAPSSRRRSPRARR